jgi:hypothetical protein
VELNTSTTQRGLNVKMKIGGFEALDLIACLILCAALNLFFGNMSFGIPIVFGVPAFFLTSLYFGKRGKPDEYLKHLLRFYLTTGYHSAAEFAPFENRMRRKIYENELQITR